MGNKKLAKQIEVKKIIKTPIDFHPKLERISMAVSIWEINEDFSHPDGFQVTFYGETFAMRASVEIVNLYGPDEKQYVDELVSIITPGSSWAITGRYIVIRINPCLLHLVLFPESYQAIVLPPEKTTYSGLKNLWIKLPTQQYKKWENKNDRNN